MNHLSLYHIFHAVASHKNISKAAKDLYISQPAISKSITKLEQELGVTLFLRNSRGVTLTEEGEILYKSTTNAFHSLELGEKTIQRIQNLGVGQLKIGVSTTLCKYLLLSYLEVFIKNYPHIKIMINCQSTFHTIEAIRNGSIDIGLISEPPNKENLLFYSVQQIHDTFVATKTYLENLKLRDPLQEVDIFSSANVMLLDEENMTRKYLNQYFEQNQIVTNQILEISNMDLLIEFAKIGLGVSGVIQEFIQDDLKKEILVEIPLKERIPSRKIGFAYLKQNYQSQALKKFIQFSEAFSLPNAIK